MPIDIVSISHIKYQNCVWNCLVAWSMWKKRSQNIVSLARNDDCLDLSASYFVFPHIWENQSFFTTSYRGRGETKRPFVLLYDICAMTKQHSEKNLNQTHSSSSEASAWLTQKEKIFFQNFGQLEGLGWAAKKAPRFRLVQCLSVCQIDFTALMKSKQRAWLTALCHKFSKVKSLSQASKYNTFLPASKWPFYFISLRNFTRHITT